MTGTHVTWETAAGIGRIVLRPEVAGKPATLDWTVLDELEGAIQALAVQRADLDVVEVRGAAPKYFVVGANIRVLETLDAASIGNWVARGHAVFGQLAALPIPTVAVVEGFALGGGLELALACDWIVAHSTARLGQPEAGLGVVPGWGGTWRLAQRVGLARAKLLCLTGRQIDADEAQRWGLVDFAGTPVEVEQFLAQLVDGVRVLSKAAVSSTKALIHENWGATAEAAMRREASASVDCWTEGDAAQRTAAFLENRRNRS
jgi:enoyl-CoA hydratase